MVPPSEHSSTPARFAPSSPFELELCDAPEVHYDYTLRPYPPASVAGHRLRSTNLLYVLLEGSGEKELWHRLIASLRDALGLDRTVWGVKLVDGRLSVELYFYLRVLSAAAQHREASRLIPSPIRFGQVRQALSGLLEVSPVVPGHVPAMMVSLDVNDEVLRRGVVEELHVYLRSGLSYDVRRNEIEHANHYLFFELSEGDRLQALLAHQANGLLHASAWGVEIQRLLLPSLYSCRTICLAAKRRTEGIYFAGIDTAQLEWFLRTFPWPATAADFVATNREAFADRRWDVGLDFTVSSGGSPDWKKWGVYGTL